MSPHWIVKSFDGLEQTRPRIVRNGQNNGAWIHSGRPWVMNEHTDRLANHTQSIELSTLVDLSRVQLVPSWHVVGPFANRNQKDFETVFGPEKSPGDIRLKAAFSGVDDRKVTWELVKTSTVNGAAGFDLAAFCRQRKFRTNDLTTYLATTIESPQQHKDDTR